MFLITEIFLFISTNILHHSPVPKVCFEFIKTQKERQIRSQRTGSKLPGCFCTKCFSMPHLVTKLRRLASQRCHPKHCDSTKGLGTDPQHGWLWLAGTVGRLTGQGWSSNPRFCCTHFPLMAWEIMKYDTKHIQSVHARERLTIISW